MSKPHPTAAQPQSPRAPSGGRRLVGLVSGAGAALAMLAFPPPDGMPVEAWRVAAVTVLMATWWVWEAIPIAATALVPVALLPLLGVAPIAEAAAPFANPLVFLFLGGFCLALAMERWNLHRRIALAILAIFAATALGWLFRPLIEGATGLVLSDAAIAVLAALALFATPVDVRRRTFLLDWSDTAKLPWGVLLLVGGGLSPGAAVAAQGGGRHQPAGSPSCCAEVDLSVL